LVHWTTHVVSWTVNDNPATPIFSRLAAQRDRPDLTAAAGGAAVVVRPDVPTADGQKN
jgi:hypothetical protein